MGGHGATAASGSQDCPVLSKGDWVWAAFYDDADWVEATILELGTTEALVRESGTQRSDWVPLTRVFEQLPGTS